MKTKKQLLDNIRAFPKKIGSTTGKATYSNFKVEGELIHFKRDNTGQPWQLDIGPVYDVYLKERFINTTVLRKYISGRTYSPSLAILIASNFIDKQGNRIG
jgi:hypothetical protein